MILSALVALVLLVVVIGAALPADHLASRTAEFPQPPAAVWSAITTVNEFPAWRPTIAKVEPVPSASGRASWREIDTHGNSLPYEITVAEPPRQLVTRIADPNLAFGGTWTYDLTPTATGGTILLITERGVVHNPIFRFVSRFVLGQTATIDEYLRALGAKLSAKT
jgi:uncharacterized protein YndB with AHSA1/START domain